MLAYKLPILAVLFIMLITVAISIVNPLILERAVDFHIANKDREVYSFLERLLLTQYHLYSTC